MFEETFYSTTFGHTQEIPNILAGDEVTWLYQQTMGDYSGFGSLGDRWSAWHGRDGLDDAHINRLRGVGVLSTPGDVTTFSPGVSASSTPVLTPNARLARLCADPVALAGHGPELYDKCLLAGLTPAGLPGPPGGGGLPTPVYMPPTPPTDPTTGLPAGLIDPSTGLPVTGGGAPATAGIPTAPPATVPAAAPASTSSATGVLQQIVGFVESNLTIIIIAGVAYFVLKGKRR